MKVFSQNQGVEQIKNETTNEKEGDIGRGSYIGNRVSYFKKRAV